MNEEWSTETPEGVDWSFLPEGMRDFVTPNPMASRPTPGFGLTVEDEMPKIINAQKHLSDDDRQFIRSAANSPVDLFYKWLVIRGESPKYSEINSIWTSVPARDLINRIKNTIKRARPYWINDDISPVDGTETISYSYPSAHAIGAWRIALFLSKKYPHLRSGLESLADRICLSRIQAGVHYPSDVAPGRAIAECMDKNGY